MWDQSAALHTAQRYAEATREVAGFLAKVSKALEGRGKPAEGVATFLTRTLFAVFTESVSFLPEDIFKALLQKCQERPTHLRPPDDRSVPPHGRGWLQCWLEATVRRFNGSFYKGGPAFDLERIGCLLAAATKD